jgi:plasmid stabilization system protein ParE
MAYKIVVKDLAKEDMQVAYDYYENGSKGQGEDFLIKLQKRFDDLEEHPHHYGYIDDQNIIRDVKLKKFPYVIIFEIIGAEVIVYSVHNTSKDPKKRLRR